MRRSRGQGEWQQEDDETAREEEDSKNYKIVNAVSLPKVRHAKHNSLTIKGN